MVNPYVKFGVINWAEVEIQIPAYNSLATRSRNGGGNLRTCGFGDVVFGGKINVFGNDGGDQA